MPHPAPNAAAPRVHIIGAGMAGLACAVRLVSHGRAVSLHEAAGQAGGRCRSFVDASLDRLIDNGNHLLLSGNRAVNAFLATIGASDRLDGPERARFPFLDVETGERWCLTPSAGPVPWWLLRADRRIPGTRARDYLEGLKLARASDADRVADLLTPGTPLYRRFWAPLTVGVLNAAPEEAAAALLWPVIKETFGRGEAACRPRMARNGLSDSFVTPALAWLTARGAEIAFNHRLRAIEYGDGRPAALVFSEETPLRLGPADQVVLAVPPAVAAGLLPGLTVPEGSRCIVNAHFRLDHAPEGFADDFEGPLGVIGGTAEWLFVRGDVASVTVSAADALAALDPDEIAARIWRDVALALGLDAAARPPVRIIKEKRATFAQTPDQLCRRPPTRPPGYGLCLAGDWTHTGLPATIEGALRSGEAAADAALHWRFT
ncbi:hydroxysqualene dehydroxylase HpnE [Rhodospirillum rubrum]|uniref:Amine oxidase n=2 Tax=Rhodospirillum rubrum TaxID=1085 RepID=Q2RYC7_RHORT|nr:hydroxysqualene dehydroxylase HpnE [Rhodospirillum rubrum]ABC20868.1 Amine oxidase [Rhodospirillum rubrum ATCC 11170]AEO46535.1 amine oxidase [Rhodospirillum rubrum F11]MBK5952425.1 amine oxidase [Rhodospirillum rubrum]QXG80569.1 hydroxysqualene dehydroxylase HpnE [Rhodospirillum rubrum]HAQ00639.1 amine oxidase [Rhodospirillum rubrum]